MKTQRYNDKSSESLPILFNLSDVYYARLNMTDSGKQIIEIKLIYDPNEIIQLPFDNEIWKQLEMKFAFE